MILYLLISVAVALLNTWINSKFFEYTGMKGIIYYIPPIALLDFIYVLIRFSVIFLILLIVSC